MKPTTTLPLAAALMLGGLILAGASANAAPLGPALGPAAAERTVTEAHGCHWRAFRGWAGRRNGHRLHKHRGHRCRAVVIRRHHKRHLKRHRHAYRPYFDGSHWHAYQPRRHRHFRYGCFWIGNVRVCN